MARGSTPLSALIQTQVRLVEIRLCSQMTFEPVCEKTNNLGLDQVHTNWPGLYSHRRWLEAGSFGFRQYRICTIRVAKQRR